MTNTYLEQDLRDGSAARVLATRVLDGVAGWAVVEMASGAVFAYAPQNYMLTYGEIAREV